METIKYTHHTVNIEERKRPIRHQHLRAKNHTQELLCENKDKPLKAGVVKPAQF